MSPPVIADDEIIDQLAESLRRLVRGLVRPLWRDMADDQKHSWRGAARVFRNLLKSFGLEIVRAA